MVVNSVASRVCVFVEGLNLMLPVASLTVSFPKQTFWHFETVFL